MKNANTEKIKTVCGICVDNCGMEIEKSGDKIIKVGGDKEHPFSKGNICIRGMNALEIANSPSRLKNPLKKVNGKFEEISWDEAIAETCRLLEGLKKEHGPEALAVYFGDPIICQGMTLYLLRLFCHLYATPNLSCTGSICNISKVMANMITYGRWTSPDYEKTDYIILWGTNPLVSSLRIRNRVLDAKKRGVKITVIDPRVTESAKIADRHIAPKPGTDGALALGMIKTIIEEHIFDYDFVERYTTGFSEIIKLTEGITFGEIEAITGVNSEEMKIVAREFAMIDKGSIEQGSSLDQHTNGNQTVRAVAVLLAITAKVDREGCNVFLQVAPTTQPITKDMTPPPAPPTGTNEHPIFTKYFRQGQAMTFPEYSEKPGAGKIRGLIVDGSNVALTWPDSTKTEKFLKGLDFLITMDTTMSETAKLSDIVLPAAGFLERDELSIQQPMSLQRKIMQVGEATHDGVIWEKILKGLGLGDKIPWTTAEEGITYLLKPTGKAYNDLLESRLDEKFHTPVIGKCIENGFPTKSGKIELSSSVFRETGYAPAPEFKMPEETPDNDYPFILTTGGRIPQFNHSQFRNISALNKGNITPEFEINPDDAKDNGISGGEEYYLSTKRGKIKVKANVTEKVMKGVIHMLHGWNEANINLLTDIEARDPISGFPSLKSLACRVERIQ